MTFASFAKYVNNKLSNQVKSKLALKWSAQLQFKLVENIISYRIKSMMQSNELSYKTKKLGISETNLLP